MKFASLLLHPPSPLSLPLSPPHSPPPLPPSLPPSFLPLSLISLKGQDLKHHLEIQTDPSSYSSTLCLPQLFRGAEIGVG